MRPRGLARLAGLLGVALALSAPGIAAAVEVGIVEPAAGAAVFGSTIVRVEVWPADASLQRVEIYLDGVKAGEATTPPYRFVVDAGEENREHVLEAVGWDEAGIADTALLRTPRIHTDDEIRVELQQLYVTLEGGDAGQSYPRSQFAVFDQGERQRIVTFERGDVPFTAVLLLDASGSMRGGRLRTALDGARAFFGAMGRLDEAKLLLFADHVLQETPFTSIPSILTLGLGEAQAGGGTALNDALYLALRRLQGRQGRKVVILLSDGVDVESVLSMEQAREASRLEPATLFWLRLPRAANEASISTAWRDPKGHARERSLLEETVAETGGRVVPLRGVEEVDEALSGILRELRDQYVIGYYPSRKGTPGTWHEVEVRPAVPGVKIRTQKGYVEP